METKKSFPPLVHSGAKILILGTMPGEESLARGEYYAHPRNAFWRILFDIYGAEYSADYKMKQRLIKQNNLALWDTVCECLRPGSLDSDIRNIAPNNIPAFLRRHKTIKTVCFNGKSAEKFYYKYWAEAEGVRYAALPSTSPAYAAMSYKGKLSAWRRVLLLA